MRTDLELGFDKAEANPPKKYEENSNALKKKKRDLLQDLRNERR